MRAWIDVGTPDAARLHRASKQVSRVAVYVQKDPTQWLRGLAGERIHRVEALELYALDRPFIAALVGRLERRMAFALSVAERELFVSLPDATLTGAVARLAI